ncbi:MAG: YegP family protein [Planctomycetaceae bacterium]|nr:YegP family protein [Planctomycetaceae bacterium]
MPAKFVLKKIKNGEVKFNLHAANGEIILSSESYKQKSSAKRGIASVQKNCENDSRYDRRENRSKKPYFVLRAANSKIIGQSEYYSTPAMMEKGIKAVMKAGSTTAVEDLT